ncbi:ricin B lectin domain-containing protein [Aspergillus desertorum]
MSDFTGAGLYTVVARHIDKRLDLDSGNRADGTKLQLYRKLDDNTWGLDQRFLFAYIGHDEYLIINAKSGTYLTAPGGNDKALITGNLISPLEKRARWKVEPVKDDSGAYYIYSVAYPQNVVDVQARGTGDGTEIITFPNRAGQNQQFFLRHP